MRLPRLTPTNRKDTMTNKLRAAFRAARTVITSMADIVRPRFFISRYHAALWEIENTWIKEYEEDNADWDHEDGPNDRD